MHNTHNINHETGNSSEIPVEEYTRVYPFPTKNLSVQFLLKSMINLYTTFPSELLFSADLTNYEKSVEEFKKIDKISNQNYVEAQAFMDKHRNVDVCTVYMIFNCVNQCGKVSYYRFGCGSDIRKYYCFDCYGSINRAFPTPSLVTSLFPDIYIMYRPSKFIVDSKIVIGSITKKIAKAIEFHYNRKYRGDHVYRLVNNVLNRYNSEFVHNVPSRIPYNNAKIAFTRHPEYEAKIKTCDDKIDSIKNEISVLMDELNKSIGPVRTDTLGEKLRLEFPSCDYA